MFSRLAARCVRNRDRLLSVATIFGDDASIYRKPCELGVELILERFSPLLRDKGQRDFQPVVVELHDVFEGESILTAVLLWVSHRQHLEWVLLPSIPNEHELALDDGFLNLQLERFVLLSLLVKHVVADSGLGCSIFQAAAVAQGLEHDCARFRIAESWRSAAAENLACLFSCHTSYDLIRFSVGTSNTTWNTGPETGVNLNSNV
jgi:hypothetical protein